MEWFISLARDAAHVVTSPVNVFLLASSTAVLLWRLTKARPISLGIAGAGLGWLLWCSLPVTSNMMLRPIESAFPVVHAQSPTWRSAHAMVILGCHHREGSLPFADQWHACSLKRNLQALLMYQQHPLPIFMSGGILEGKHQSEASTNKFFLQTLGVPEHHLHALPSGTNTEQEAQALGSVLAGKTVALVTSASHQLRAGRYLKHQGIEVIPIPVDFLSEENERWGKPGLSYLLRSERAVYEWFGLLHQSMILSEQDAVPNEQTE